MKLESSQIRALKKLFNEAGIEALKYYKTKLDVSLKDGDFPVTEADLAVDKLLTKGLKKITPNVPIVSEERPLSHGETADAYWLVDPIDGTKGFIEETDDFVIQAGLIVNEQPAFGIVFAPAYQQLYWGGPDYGAYRKVSFNPQESIQVQASRRDIVAMTSKSHQHPKTDNLLTKLGALTRESMHSALKFCRIAEGEAQVYARLTPFHYWDAAAPHAIALAAGATVTSLDDLKPITYPPTKDLLIPNIICHALGDYVAHILEQDE